MPKVLPTIPNTPPQGIQALLDKVYLWNPDAANNLIIRINELLKEIEEAGGAVASVNGQTGEVVLTAEDINALFAGEEESVQTAIGTLKEDQGHLGDQVSSIESKIPGEASEANQLVTKNDLLSVPTFTYKVVAELPEVGEEKVLYLVPKEGEASDVHDEYIWIPAQNKYELIGTTAVALGDYLPLSGGVMTGSISFSAGSHEYKINPTSYGDLEIFLDGVQNARFETAGFVPGVTGRYSLGRIGRVWKNVFTASINNGADIAIPTTGGTLALAEDIAESVTTKDLTVGTDEGTLNIGVTAGVATIATNNGLDIVAQTKFDTAPTTDDTTAWADVNPTALVTKQQVVTAVSEAGGDSLPNQTGNAGKFLTTDGTNVSWGEALVNMATHNKSLALAGQSAGTFGTAVGVDSTCGVSGTAVGYNANAYAKRSIAIGYYALASAEYAIQIGEHTNVDANTFKVGNKNGNFELMDVNGNVPRERLKNLVEILPTEENGYTTVKNYGNGYVEITGYTAIGTVGASTGSEVQIDLPAGYTMANANYWVNIAPTSETTMFDFKAEAKARSTTHFMVAYKNEDETTGLTAAGVYWEVRGMLATE